MSEPKTPIQEWIEQKRNLYNEFKNSMAKKTSYTRACQELLEYLGLKDIPDPKEWVEEHKKLDAIDVSPEDTTAMVDKIFEAERVEKESIAHLKAENERLKAGLIRDHKFTFPSSTTVGQLDQCIFCGKPQAYHEY